MPTHPGAAKAEGVSRLKQLIDVAREGSTDKRADLLREITDVFMAAPDRYTSAEMQHFDVILSKVTESVEVALRREIAERLAERPFGEAWIEAFRHRLIVNRASG